MTKPKVIYLVVSGASSAGVVPNLLPALARLERPLYTLLTDNASRVISPYHLADLPGHRLVESYFDPILLADREPGLILVAPATFNTVNKLAHGIADTLAHSLVAEAIGAKWPVIVAPSLNPALAAHPQFARSLETLQVWGVTVLEPQPDGELLVMAPVEAIITAAERALG